MRGSKPAQPGHEDAAAPTAALASTIAEFLAVSSVHLTAQLVSRGSGRRCSCSPTR